jgi:hypothetical protein
MSWWSECGATRGCPCGVGDGDLSKVPDRRARRASVGWNGNTGVPRPERAAGHSGHHRHRAGRGGPGGCGRDRAARHAYTDAIYDETTGQWISRAEVAEIAFTAFASRRRADHVPGRLVVAVSRTSTPTRTGQPAFPIAGSRLRRSAFTLHCLFRHHYRRTSDRYGPRTASPGLLELLAEPGTRGCGSRGLPWPVTAILTAEPPDDPGAASLEVGRDVPSFTELGDDSPAWLKRSPRGSPW